MEHAALIGTIRRGESVRLDVFESMSRACEQSSYAIFKVLVDAFFASLALLILLPILPVVALLIKLESRGPVFYLQERVGKNGKIFTMYKFRTMYTDAERITGPVWSNKNDPRITRVGRLLRKTYIDELPQCINILMGEMSLVGPRPERPEFTARFDSIVPGFSMRSSVRPGITGLAQVSCLYRMNVRDIRKKLKYDMFYISRQCCVLDIKILLRTTKFWINSCLA